MSTDTNGVVAGCMPGSSRGITRKFPHVCTAMQSKAAHTMRWNTSSPVILHLGSGGPLAHAAVQSLRAPLGIAEAGTGTHRGFAAPAVDLAWRDGGVGAVG